MGPRGGGRQRLWPWVGEQGEGFLWEEGDIWLFAKQSLPFPHPVSAVWIPWGSCPQGPGWGHQDSWTLESRPAQRGGTGCGNKSSTLRQVGAASPLDPNPGPSLELSSEWEGRREKWTWDQNPNTSKFTGGFPTCLLQAERRKMRLWARAWLQRASPRRGTTRPPFEYMAQFPRDAGAGGERDKGQRLRSTQSHRVALCGDIAASLGLRKSWRLGEAWGATGWEDREKAQLKKAMDVSALEDAASSSCNSQRRWVQLNSGW